MNSSRGSFSPETGSRHSSKHDFARLSISSEGDVGTDATSRRRMLKEIGLSVALIEETIQFERWITMTETVIFSRAVSSTFRGGKKLFGYGINSLLGGTSELEYLLTTEDIIEDDLCCCTGGCCVALSPTIEDMSLMLSTISSGSNLIHVYSVRGDRFNDGLPTVQIVINTEVKGIVQLGFPSSDHDKAFGDRQKALVPTGVINNDNDLVLIFRSEQGHHHSSSHTNNTITEILTADGTGFVVARVGSVDELENDGGIRDKEKEDGDGGAVAATAGLKVKSPKNHFCLQFMDHKLARSWKELIFGVSVVFFYYWLVRKVFGKKLRARHIDDEKCCPSRFCSII